MLSILYLLCMTIGVISSFAWLVHILVWVANHSTGKNVLCHLAANIVIFVIAARLGEAVLGLI